MCVRALYMFNVYMCFVNEGDVSPSVLSVSSTVHAGSNPTHVLIECHGTQNT
jgi:hypothetical protein